MDRGDRPRRHRARARRGRDHRLCPAVRRAVLQHRPQRLAAGGPPDRDARHDHRPPVRLSAAGRQLRGGAGRERCARRRDRGRRRAHGPHPVVGERQAPPGARLAVSTAAPRAPSAREPGAQRGADRRAVGDLAERVRRDRAPVASMCRGRDGRGTIRARARTFPGERHHTELPTRASAATRRSRRSPSCSLRSRRAAS